MTEIDYFNFFPNKNIKYWISFQWYDFFFTFPGVRWSLEHQIIFCLLTEISHLLGAQINSDQDFLS